MGASKNKFLLRRLFHIPIFRRNFSTQFFFYSYWLDFKPLSRVFPAAFRSIFATEGAPILSSSYRA